MTRSLRTLKDITSQEFTQILERTGRVKAAIKSRKPIGSLDNRVVALLFEKPSTRTRASFESAIARLGGTPVYLPSADLQMKRGEPVKDTARMFGNYFDAIVARVYSHQTILELDEFAGVPIINGLCNLAHPTQAICDLFTVKEVKGDLKGLTLAYIGDGNNVCHSLLLACAHAGMNINVGCPDAYGPKEEFVNYAKDIAQKSGSKIAIMSDPREAACSSDVLYTDTWVSMGEESEKEKKLKDFQGYQINKELLGLANRGAIIMHCLPAYRGYEITEEVMEGPNSVIWQQGENKMHAAAGVLDFFFGK
ncbi:MAG TPA: ornithine carbamoyltransferase [bacterium]|nr:ornithine carbamoyltransferase [Myxococcales bacterium]OQA59049.1 MAG: Ornithine carbamoyltransferase [bacterium ADurb.Bin270]HPW45694.1 ornithine carbamoyltransferase [bacterium]HQC51175.1 ornithine carbamoyltransferase [bacterium]